MASRVLGVLAGAAMPLELLEAWARSAELVIAADGAADRLLEAGIKAHIAVGDFDSISPRAKAEIGDLRYDPDQEGTDCDKLLRVARGETGVEGITLVGVEGDRADHFLATIHSAARSELTIRLGLVRAMGYIVSAGVSEWTLDAERLVSLLPITHCERVSFEGVRWPLHEVELGPLARTSVSNRALGGPVRVTVGTGKALLVATYEPEEMPIW